MRTAMTLLVCLTCSLSSAAGATDVVDLAREVESAAFGGDADRLDALYRQIEAAHASQPSNATRYAGAYTGYRLATALAASGADTDRAREVLASAQEQLEAYVEAAPAGSEELAEGLTLLSAVMGYRIGLEPALGMRLGARSGQLLSKALRIAPNNPRVHLQEGVSKYNTPKMWGGSKKKAEAALRKAVSLFAERRDAADWPDWGYLDSLAWLGQALADQGKVDEARAAYQQALAINPEMGWIRYQLLPALDG